MDDMKLETANVFLSMDPNGDEQTKIMSPKAQMAFAKSTTNFYSS